MAGWLAGFDAEYDAGQLDQGFVARLGQDVHERETVPVAVLLWQSELSEQQVAPREWPLSVLLERIGQLALDTEPVSVREGHASMLAQSRSAAV